jgi:hypothetical protein
MFEISLQPEGFGRPDRMAELCGNRLSWSTKLEGWCARALIMLWTILAAAGLLCSGFARSQNILAYTLLLDLA